MKYLTITAGLNSITAENEMEARIRAKGGESLVGKMASEGTTPRRITDLIGSLCDLTSGSGDKGTPIVLNIKQKGDDPDIQVKRKERIAAENAEYAGSGDEPGTDGADE